METMLWLTTAICFAFFFLILHLAGKVYSRVEYKMPRTLNRPENCQRCGQQRPWLYYCECVHEDENVERSLYVVRRALERQVKKAPGWDQEFGLKMVEMLRVMLKKEIE